MSFQKISFAAGEVQEGAKALPRSYCFPLVLHVKGKRMGQLTCLRDGLDRQSGMVAFFVAAIGRLTCCLSLCRVV